MSEDTKVKFELDGHLLKYLNDIEFLDTWWIDIYIENGKLIIEDDYKGKLIIEPKSIEFDDGS